MAKVLVAAGSEVNVGDPIMVVVEDEADVSAFKDFKADGANTSPAQASVPEPEPAQAPVTAPSPAPPTAPSPAPPTTQKPSLPTAEQPASLTSGGRVMASPRARMLAAELGYALSAIAGSGPGGRVVAADVQSHTPLPSGAPSEDESKVVAPPGDGSLDFAVNPTSASIAARLTYSAQTAPVSDYTIYALRHVCACAAALLLDHGVCS